MKETVKALAKRSVRALLVGRKLIDRPLQVQKKKRFSSIGRVVSVSPVLDGTRNPALEWCG